MIEDLPNADFYFAAIIKPIDNEIRDPYNILLKKSRPYLSVPNHPIEYLKFPLSSEISTLPLKPRLLEYLGASLKYARVEKLKFLLLSYNSVINAVLLALNPPLDLFTFVL